MSLEEGIFTNSLKSTIVRPRLKKTNPRSGRYELISTDFELDIFVKNSRKSSCDQIRRALWAAQAITSPPICLSFVPFHRDSCFSCPQRSSTNDWQWKHRCTGASGSQCRFRHCGPLDHVTGAARSILCWRQSPGMVWVISMWPNANLPGQRSTISTSQSRLRCPTGIGAGSTKIHRLHRRFGRTHWWILSEPSHVTLTTLRWLNRRQFLAFPAP